MYVAHTNLTLPAFASRHRGKGDHPRAKVYPAYDKPDLDPYLDRVYIRKVKGPEYIELETLDTQQWEAFKNPRNQLIHTLISWSPAHGRDDENIFRQGDWKTRNTTEAFRLLKHPNVRLGEGDPGPSKSMPKRLLDHDQNFKWLTQQIGSREGAWAFTKAVLTLFYQERDNLSLDEASQKAKERIKTHQEKLDSSKSGSQTSLSHNRKSRSTQTRQVSIASPNRDEPSVWLFPWPRPKFFLTSRAKGSSMYELGDWTIKPK